MLKIHNHPFYDHANIDYDFSILLFAKTASFPQNVASVKLPDEDDQPLKGDIVFATGWGETKNDGYHKIPIFLRGVFVPIVDFKKCQKAYESETTLTEHMLCAGYSGLLTEGLVIIRISI